MNKNKIHKITAVLLALLFWQIVAMILNRSFLLSSPVEVVKALFELGGKNVFWMGLGKSIFKILLGFLAGGGVGIFLAGLSYRFKLFEIYISPYIMVIRSVPVASFVIIILIWLKSGIAAEVIGRPKNTLGFFLFDAKIYLETSKVFAITLIVILCSAIFERLIIFIMERFFGLIKRVY